MKNPLKVNLLALILVFVSQLLLAQKIVVLQDADKLVKGAGKVVLNEKLNTPSFVTFEKAVSIKEQDHEKWIKANVCKVGAEYSFKLLKAAEPDKTGMKHYKYNQYYKGIPIENAVYILHSKNDLLLTANGECHTTISIKPQQINRTTALQTALTLFENQDNVKDQSEKGNNLTILNKGNDYILCYKFILFSMDPLKRLSVYVDATNGAIVSTEQKIHNTDVPAQVTTKYSGVETVHTTLNGSNYILRESDNGRQIITLNCNNTTNIATATDFQNASTTWIPADAGYDVHYGLEKTYDYYKNIHARNSFDNAGSPIYGYAHYSQGYNNAFWDGSEMIFGDGDGIEFNSLTSMDVTGHEFTHAVTEHSAGLVYQGESGALNESFSDIFGVCIDYYANPGSANFQIGEQISPKGAALRDLADPERLGQPKCYQGNNWNSGTSDNGGVHTNSGVQNYWFYLLVNGAATNSAPQQCQTTACPTKIEAIGMDKAATIAYATLTNYLTPSSTYANARAASIQAATDLYGACSKEVRTVTNAWFAVGVGGIFTGTPVILTSNGNGSGDCVGNAVSIKLSATGCGDLYWYDAPTGGTLVGQGETFYTPRISATTTYYVEAHIGCTSSSRVAVTATVNLQSIALVTVTPSTTICKGSSVALTAGNAVSYSWQPEGNFVNAALATQTVSPISTTTYNVIGTTAGGCKSQATVTVTVLGFIANSATICQNETATLSATGANSYVWSTGAVTSSISVRPAVTTSYSVTGTFTGICSQTLAVTVTQLTTINVSVNSPIICQGDNATLIANGADSYVWSTGSTNPYIIVSPTVTTSYTITGTNHCGTGTAVSIVTVIPTAHVVVSPDAITICEGENPTINLSGADVYVWNPAINIPDLEPGVYTFEICGKNVTKSTNNLICNGDFSGGDNCFLTDYAKYDATQGPRKSGQYWVGPSFFDNWLIANPSDPMQDHTLTTSDNMMLSVDGMTKTNLIPNVIWETKDPIIVPASDGDCGAYAFGFWATSANYSAPDFEVFFQVDNGPWVSVAKQKGNLWNAGDGKFDDKYKGDFGNAVRWAEYCKYSWTPTGSKVKIKIMDNAIGDLIGTADVTSVHDYMIDDIYFQCAPNTCPGTCATLTITVLEAPNVNVATNNNLICPGNTATITATSDITPTTYLWAPGGATTNSIIVTPPSTQAYQVTGTIPNGCTDKANTAITVIEQPLGISSCVKVERGETLYYDCSGVVQKVEMCLNNTVTLSVNPQENYLWNTGATTQTIDVSPTTTTTYSVSSTSCGWPTSTATITVVIHELPILTPLNGVAICSGETLNITLSTTNVPAGFVWRAGNNDNVLGESAVSTQTVAAITDQLSQVLKTPQFVTYTVTPISQYKCYGTPGVTTVTVNPLPGMVSPNSKIICNNSSVNLALASDPTIPSTFKWIAANNMNTTGESTGLQTTGTISDVLSNTSNNFQTVTYSVTPTSIGANCLGIQQIVNITVVPTLTISTTAFTICSGNTVPPLTVNAPVNIPSNYTWVASANANVGGISNSTSPSAGITNILTNTTTATQLVTYTVSPISVTGNCTEAPQVVTVKVNPRPVMNSAATQTVCSGTALNIALTANTGGAAFTWIAANNLNITGESTTLKTTSTINDVVVNNSPLPTNNENVLYNVTPTISATGCVGAPQTVTVTVKPPPTVTSAATKTICTGSTVGLTLTANVPTSFFSWIATFNFNVSGESFIIPQTANPINDILTTTQTTLQTVIYTVTPVPQIGQCTGGTAQTVMVTVVPTVTLSITNPTICSGSAFPAVNVNLPSNFTWVASANANVGGIANSTSPSPIITNTLTNTTASAQSVTYTITPTSVTGTCTGTPKVVTITVNPAPTLTVTSATVCAGITATLTASGDGAAYSWSTGQTTASIAVAPAGTTSYTVISTSAKGCTNKAIATVTVKPLPVISVNSPTICISTTATLTATGGTTYVWSTGTSANPILVSPPTTATFTVTGTANGCSAIKTVTVTVNTTPPVISVNAATICNGQSTTLTVTGGSTYVWSTGAITNPIVVSPSTTTTYTVTGTTNSCLVAKTTTVTVKPTPTLSISPTTNTGCSGQTTVLTANGGAINYSWSTGQTGTTITVSPAITTVYTVTGIAANGCSAIATKTVIVTSSGTFGIITTIVGNHTAGYSGDGGAATSAELYYPLNTDVDCDGNLYIVDFVNNVIRKVDTYGTITTIAGTGTAGYNGDGIPATSAQLSAPYDVKIDNVGNIYIADETNHRIRKINTSGIITTIAGNGNPDGGDYSGDGGLATSTAIGSPESIDFDSNGNLYIANEYSLRKVAPSGIISTIATTDWTFRGFGGDGGPASSAKFYDIANITTDKAGNIYVRDAANERIRKINTSGIVNTIVGNGSIGYSGDGGLATAATVNFGQTGGDMIIDDYGNLYFSDYFNNVVRKVDASGIITTIAGNGTQGYNGDGGSATSAELYFPMGLALDAANSLYIADVSNQVIRKIDYSSTISFRGMTDEKVIQYSSSKVATSTTETSFVLYPNPNNGTMTLSYTPLTTLDKGLIKIYDITGRDVADYLLDNNSTQIQINESELSSGTYIYKIFINDKEVKHDKIIVLR